MTVLNHITELVVTSCWCGVGLAVPQPLYDEANRNGKSIYCPIGHTFVYNGTENDRLRRQLAAAEERFRRAEQRTAEAERSAIALKGQLTKIKKRAAAGLCLHCNRHFTNLERHVASKHATEAAK